MMRCRRAIIHYDGNTSRLQNFWCRQSPAFCCGHCQTWRTRQSAASAPTTRPPASRAPSRCSGLVCWTRRSHCKPCEALLCPDVTCLFWLCLRAAQQPGCGAGGSGWCQCPSVRHGTAPACGCLCSLHQQQQPVALLPRYPHHICTPPHGYRCAMTQHSARRSVKSVGPCDATTVALVCTALVELSMYCCRYAQQVRRSCLRLCC